jgi:hypothetical protein
LRNDALDARSSFVNANPNGVKDLIPARIGQI